MVRQWNGKISDTAGGFGGVMRVGDLTMDIYTSENFHWKSSLVAMHCWSSVKCAFSVNNSNSSVSIYWSFRCEFKIPPRVPVPSPQAIRRFGCLWVRRFEPTASIIKKTRLYRVKTSCTQSHWTYVWSFSGDSQNISKTTQHTTWY